MKTKIVRQLIEIEKHSDCFSSIVKFATILYPISVIFIAGFAFTQIGASKTESVASFKLIFILN